MLREKNSNHAFLQSSLCVIADLSTELLRSKVLASLKSQVQEANATPHVAFSVCQQYKRKGKDQDPEPDDYDEEVDCHAPQEKTTCLVAKSWGRKRKLLKKKEGKG